MTDTIAGPSRLCLRAELAKLDDLGCARKLLTEVQPDRLAPFGLHGPADGLTARFTTQADVDRFVASLADGAAVRLMDVLSRWRGNGVADRLLGSRRWRSVTVPIGMVDVVETEEDLRPVWRALGGNLEAIARHPVVLDHATYRSRAPEGSVAVERLLAVGVGGRRLVLDGVHRAIQMARRGGRTLDLLVADRSSGPATSTRVPERRARARRLTWRSGVRQRGDPPVPAAD